MRSLWERARFAWWTQWLRLRLARVGARLELEAPHGARLMGHPRLRLHPLGDGDGLFVLKVGRDVRVGPDLILELWANGTNELALGDATVISDWAVIDLRSGSIRLADHVQLRSWTLLKSSGALTLGSRCIVSYHATVHCAARVELGDRVTLAERCTVVDSDHPHDGSDAYFMDAPVETGPVEIGSNTFVATGSVVARGARIGARSLVAAGSVVTAGPHPDGLMLAGAPARPVRSLGAEAETG